MFTTAWLAATESASPTPSASAESMTLAAKKHWAFQPPVRPSLPRVKNAAWIRTPVDYFVLQKLEQQKIQPSPAADRVTLIRRLTFDLTGLPPSPEAIHDFVSDPSADAYEKLVERLLASPHYGERWGRHWLDAAGYFDSNGYFDADSDRPLAYRYRDYVVRAFNADKPFDRFVEEQIAGDELVGFIPDGDVLPEMIDALTATHFLRNAPDGTGESDGNPLEQKVDRYSVLEGNVQILGSALLGLTLQCARCHDHKFEPISQEEYYALQAIFRPAFNPDRWLKPNERVVAIGTRAEREANRQRIAQAEAGLKAVKESIEGLLAPFRKLALEENLDRLDERARKQVREALDAKEKSAEMKALLKQHDALVTIHDEELTNRFPEVASGYESLRQALKKRENQKPAPLPKLAVLFEPADAPPEHHLLVRGVYAREGRAVQPGVPSVLNVSKARFATDSQATNTAAALGDCKIGAVVSTDSPPAAPALKTSGRRLKLARWLTAPQHPTVARVVVNRLWQRHFGEGLVPTLDNMGLSGARPTHPELLDYLATEFIQSGWRLKSLHRLMVLSSTYRQSSASREKAWALDPDNHWLWRSPLQRLDAESIRDALLWASGEIHFEFGGPYVPTDRTEEGQYVVNESKYPGYRRRSIYLQQRRSKPVTFLELFDASQMGVNCTRRQSSTVPLQSLALLNSEFIRARSKGIAARLADQPDELKRIQRAFEMLLGRQPKPDEIEAAQKFLQEQSRHYANKEKPEVQIWADFCQMLAASNGFLYVQ
jgi:hypothetical protein